MTIDECLISLGEHFVGLWVYAPFSKQRREYIVSFNIDNAYWETDSHATPIDALQQAIRVVCKDEIIPQGIASLPSLHRER